MATEKQMYPVWKVEIYESVYQKDSDYADEDDYRKCICINYLKKSAPDQEWSVEYEEMAGSMIYAFHKSAITLTQLQEDSYAAEQFQEGKVAGFIYNGHVFNKDLHWINDQKCICATSEEYYNEYSDDNSVKIDVMHSRVEILKHNTLHLVADKLYYDGQFVYNLSDFREEFNLDRWDVEFMHDNFKEVVKRLYPEIQSFSSWSGGCSFSS